ncbi:zeta toxin family protein [Streptomyces turgidiscabies]|uniref:UDP-N-acetylglucosamine kinase n=1 Tax=Streptomyces turgidiscabies (strain Car8) TaxID=698760 RepID=L7FF65_STRT8|nr:zeta toxin family protein [Streptomyces turgidiscabies]ELP69952.1 zeta toxin [Streptomyces turgidiscabies Car8]MDX3500146.1 zeta toxin family protein [Streptomyces turgidiscabies]GAQ77179.1 toxin PezT [Streptomyces turgidiscabies]
MAGQQENADADVRPAVLPVSEHEEILASRILPAWTGDAVPQDQPVAVLIGGPPGSGKSTVCQVLKAVLDRRGGAVLIGRDLYKTDHPAYRSLLHSDDRTAGVRVRPDVLRWQAEVEEYVRGHRFDALVETPAVDPEQARAYREAGYRVEVVVLAEAQAVTQLSILERYLAQVAENGAGRYVSWGNHDQVARRLPESLEVIETEQLADRVMVVQRDLQVLYDNALAEPSPAGAHRALHAARSRPWTAPETWRFRRQANGLHQQLHPAANTPERRLVVAGGLERAAALAEPVRRIAQPLTVPPGVDYHRLSADEHRFIFQELIVPMHLSDITAHAQPVVLYMVGPQGAGKTYAARTLRRVLRGRRPIRIEGGMFKAMHPDYRQLREEEPRTASARIRPDYRAWQEQAEAYVRERRGDLLIEIAPDDVDHFLDGARRHHAAGYRVELIVLGGRAADSRLGIATRCAEVARIGGTARFTSTAAHQASFQVLADVVRAAERVPDVVDSVSVIRRDLTAVYRNARTPGGAWTSPPRGGDAVEVEQQRRYTTAEAAQFLATLRRVQGELPQYRRDLVEIAALAWPLMPVHLQPRALADTVPVMALPVRHGQAPNGYWPLSSFMRAV